jgi:transcriptional regulator with XRE-family HTH domain
MATAQSPAERLARQKLAIPAGRPNQDSVDSEMRRRRLMLRLTLRDVADATGLSLGYVSQVERGVNQPSLAMAKVFSRFFGCTIEQLWPEVTEARP